MAKLIDSITAAVTANVLKAMGLDADSAKDWTDESAAVKERIAEYRRPVAAYVPQTDRRQTAEQPAETVTRRRRRARPQKQYQITPRRKNAARMELRSNDADVYNALVRKPMTAAEIQKATGLKIKSVESSLWYLRNHDADGNRLAKRAVNGSNALVQSVEIDRE